MRRESARTRMAETVRMISEKEKERRRRGMGREMVKRMRWERMVVVRRGRKEERREVTVERSLTGRPKKPWKTLWMMVAREQRERKNKKKRGNKRSGKGRGKSREVVVLGVNLISSSVRNCRDSRDVA